MSPNRRIILNIVATYGRSLYALVIGVLTSRWALNGLGVVDYGLYGVIGGLLVFLEFINGTLANANARFYAVSLGRARVIASKEEGVEDVCRWFNTALSIHITLPWLLVSIGYPIGIWAIEHYLTIPPERMLACIWVFRIACISSVIGVLCVPFMAMYTAKQYIAELTIYSYICSTVNALFLFYVIRHPGDWLVIYALVMAGLSIVPKLIICVRAMVIFPECRISLRYMCLGGQIREVLSFVGYNIIGTVSIILRIQGINILVNKVFGPRVNAAMSIGNSVDAHASTLSSSMMGAFVPAITALFGSGDFAGMRSFVYRACKFGAVLLLIFMIPLLVELDTVLDMWLINPPNYALYFCAIYLVVHLMEILCQGFHYAIQATGRIKEAQRTIASASILTLPVMILVVYCGGGVYAIGAVLVVSRFICLIMLLYYGRQIAGLSELIWAKNVFLPVFLSTLLTFMIAIVPRLNMAPSFSRVVITTIVSEFVFLPLIWGFVLDGYEKSFVKSRICRIWNNLFLQSLRDGCKD